MNKLTQKPYMFRKFFFPRLFLFLLIVFFVNLFFRKGASKPDSYAALLSYNQLYWDKDKIHIKSIHTADDSIEVSLEGKILNQPKNIFRIFSGNTLIAELQTPEKRIKFKPRPGNIDKISITANGSGDSVSMSVDYTPDSLYRKQGFSKGVVYEIIPNTPDDPARLYTVRDWALDYWGDDTANTAAETRRMLKDSIRIGANESSTEKILKIARFILQRTAGREGTPTDELSALHPLHQLRCVQDGKSKIWCGNFSSIFSFLASSAGLPVRLVSCGLDNGQYTNGVHVFCEVYLKEEQSWVYVDLTAKNILVSYNKKWLNAIDIQRLLKYNIQDSNWVAWHYEKDSIYETPYFRVADLSRYYFHPGNTFMFYYGDFLKKMTPKNLWSRMIKFFYARPYYALYSDDFRLPNYDFYLRIFTNYLLALAFLAYVYRFLKNLMGFESVCPLMITQIGLRS